MSAVDTPAPLTFDPVDSHVRLRGTDVEVVLCGLERVPDATSLELSRDGTSVSAPVEATATEVRARTPRSGLTDGQWSIALAGQPVDGRLLVQGARPLVLLLGAAAPRSVVPRSRRAAPAPGLAGRVVRRVVRAVRR
jgi:hypothetical protein